jgi:hypothetical protein
VLIGNVTVGPGDWLHLQEDRATTTYGRLLGSAEKRRKVKTRRVSNRLEVCPIIPFPGLAG